MRVTAKKLGFYEHMRRYEGDVFNLKDEKDFSSRWMERVDGKTSSSASESVPPVVIPAPSRRGRPAKHLMAPTKEVI